MNAPSNAKLEPFRMITGFGQRLLDPSSRLERRWEGKDSSTRTQANLIAGWEKWAQAPWSSPAALFGALDRVSWVLSEEGLKAIFSVEFLDLEGRNR